MSLTELIEAYKGHTNEALGQLGMLSDQLAITQLRQIRKSWKRLNRQFSDTYKTEGVIVEEYNRCLAQIRTFKGKEKIRFLKDLNSTTIAFRHKAVEKAAKILSRLEVASKELGSEDYPIIFEMSLSRPSLATRITKGFWNHRGKVALTVAGMILASQTAEWQFVWNSPYTVYAREAMKTLFYDNFSTAVSSVFACAWAIPNAFGAWWSGSKKTAIATGVAAATLVGLPHVVPPGYSLTGWI